MDKKEGSGLGGRLILVLFIVAIVFTVTSITLWLAGQQVIAVLLGSATLFIAQAVYTLLVVGLTAWFTKSTFKDGAEIVLTAKISEDRGDTTLLNQVGNLTRDILRLVKDERGEPQQLPPMPARWLPKYDALPGPETDEGIN